MERRRSAKDSLCPSIIPPVLPQGEGSSTTLRIDDVLPVEVANLSSMRPEALHRQLPGTVTCNGQHYTVVLRMQSFAISYMRINTQCSQWHACSCQSFRQLSWRRMPTHPCVYTPVRSSHSRGVGCTGEYRLHDATSYPSPTIFNAPTYKGMNIGCYVNQGGLIEAIKKMVEVSSKIFPVPDWKVVRRPQKYIVMLSTSAAGSIGLVVQSYSLFLFTCRKYLWRHNTSGHPQQCGTSHTRHEYQFFLYQPSIYWVTQASTIFIWDIQLF